MRWVLISIKRFLPACIPLFIVATLAIVFELQNHTKISPKDDFRLITDDQLAVKYKSYHSGDAERSSFIGPEFSIRVAKRTVMNRRAGLGLFDRGHNLSFEVDLPEFLIHSPFLKKLSQQLCNDYRQSANEFAKVDWSLVLDCFRDQSYALRNWEGMIDVNFAHVTPKAVSLVELHWEYTGGAHGNGSCDGKCFVEDQGMVRQLKLSDIFDPESNWERRLVDFCVSDLRRQGASFLGDHVLQDSDSTPNITSIHDSKNAFAADDDPDSKATGPEMDSDFISADQSYQDSQFSTSDLTSFTLSPAGMRFYFSPYHVGSYAEGVYSVGVPFTVIRDCIPEDSPARLFMTATEH